MRTPSMQVVEHLSDTHRYLLITDTVKVQQAFEQTPDRGWVRTELKSALLDIGVPGTRKDTTHTLTRRYHDAYAMTR